MTMRPSTRPRLTPAAVLWFLSALTSFPTRPARRARPARHTWSAARPAVFALLGVAWLTLLPACGNEQPSSDDATPKAEAAPNASVPQASGTVVLYTSADDYVLKELIAAFEKSSGLKVMAVGDTEATKTFGLVQRLLDEKDKPRADVWWSSEPMGTIRLAREGLLAPLTLEPATRFSPEGDGWPSSLRGEGGLWFGFAPRARVIAYHTGRVEPRDVPRTLAQLTDPRWKGKVGMARPLFGTTRAHLAALITEMGEPSTRAWLEAMKANEVKLYDGNASVVRAISNGEITVGLTDSDDVWSGQRNTWPVAASFEAIAETAPGSPRFSSLGALVLPNTVAIIKGGPNPAGAAKLANFLLSREGELVLARSDSRNVPIRPEARTALGEEFKRYDFANRWEPDYVAVEEHAAKAVELFQSVFAP